ncbi:MAG: glycerol-3-phosphate dehydrogenase/oxidase [Agromyces sp.]
MSKSAPTPELRPEFAALETAAPEVLIIGGGINGISILRDLSLQGVNTLLVEANDVVSGASAASSHMIHGGIRYLENGEFRLVRESVQERNDLLKTAPHVVKPLLTTVPIHSYFSGILQAPLRMIRHGGGKRSERGAALIGIGLMIYESFSRQGGSMPRARFRGRAASLRTLPSLNPSLKCTAAYYDASVHEPERLALDLIADAKATGNANIVTYARAAGTADGGVVVEDALTGARTVVRARVVINASGPYTDLTNEALGRSTQFMGGTKGSHIVVDHPALYQELKGRELFFENSDGRIVLTYPVKGRVLIGTTDIFADPREPVRCTEEEVDYFFDLVKHVLPGVHLDRSQIVFRFAGIRPLPRQDVTQPGFVSRDYRIDDGTLPNAANIPLLSVVGGKWTTFRALGEHVSGDVLALLGRERVRSTKGRAIGGGRDFPRSVPETHAWVAVHRGALSEARASALLQRYGTRASEVINWIGASETPLATLPDYSVEEFGFLARMEQAVHLDDILLRRTTLAFAGLLSTERVAEIAAAVAVELGWSEEHRLEEVQRAWRILAEQYGVHEQGSLLTQ